MLLLNRINKTKSIWESLEHLDHQFNNSWISEEYYDKRKAELLGTVENEHFPPNQVSLDIFAEDHK